MTRQIGKQTLMTLVLIALPVLMTSHPAYACKQTAAASEAANKAAIMKSIEGDKDLNGYKVTRITHEMNIYAVKLKGETERRIVKYQVVTRPDCHIDIKRMEDSK